MTEALIIGLGGNVGDDAAILARFGAARDALAQLGDVRTAPVYRSAPHGPPQPPYLNTAVRIAIADGEAPQPRELVDTLHELERLLGRDRVREVHWGPRTLDLDVLLWGTRELARPELIVPHPRLVERRFALRPCADLLGFEAIVPGTGGRTLDQLLAATADQELEVVTSAW